ncbi:MAG TPA: acyltransferase [Rhodanobacteraceae bacterium]|nr:acyltransferase [Rhodanobacteraceae bacterium]
MDGLRAVSISLVLYGHLEGGHGFPSIGITRWFGDVAHLGVTVFFVISGFLITSLLMSERERTGTISLKNFYLRRTLRIFPAFYAFILALIAASVLGWIDLGGRDLAFALTYTVNYDADRSWNIGHLWSLSIEEQFYLLWPFVFLMLRERRAVIAAVLAFAAGPLVRLAMRLAFPAGSPWRDLEIFPAMADSIAIGCVLALLRPWLLEQAWYLRLTGSAWLAIVLVPLILAINSRLGYGLVDLVGSPILLVSIALLIEASTRRAQSLAGRFLNLPPVVFLGVLSYSLYLWQQPFLNRHLDTTPTSFPLNLALAFGCALLSYFLIERPLVGVRRRLERSPVLPDAKLARTEGAR